MKYLTTLALLLLAITLFGQSRPQTSTKRFLIGVSFSPDYTNIRITGDKEWVDSSKKMQSPRLGFTTGIVATYQLNNKFTIKSGLQFADKGDKIEINMSDDYWITPDNLINTNANKSNDPLIPELFKDTYHLYYLSVPLQLNYYVIKKNLGVFLLAGVSTDFLVGAKKKNKLTYNNRVEKSSSKIETDDFNKICFTGFAGFGIDYQLTAKIKLQLEPEIRYSFTPMEKRSPTENHFPGYYPEFDSYFYSAGVNFTVLF